MQTLTQLVTALDAGTTTARTLIEESLARIADPGGEGARAFISVHETQARAMADAMDGLRRAGRAPSRYAGLPLAVKDLFDIAGEPTPAGSRAAADARPAARHAPALARMLRAGFVPMGRTNMTEFAFSGLGINPHYGTPVSPWHRAERRVPGGSSSGSAVAVADSMAAVALGTDTGGSCRIPAVFCGITGYKPTARRVPITGVLPLAPSLDSVGPLGVSVACCAIVDAILAGQEPVLPTPQLPSDLSLSGLRLGVPENVVQDGMDADVAAAFSRALSVLSAAGARLTPIRLGSFAAIGSANAKGGFAAAEAFAWHRELLARRAADYDPRVRVRIERGAGMSAAEYLDLLAARAAIIAQADAETAPFDALVMPTVPIIAPRIDDLAEDAAYNQANLLVLRNPAIANFLDRCAISLPCHRGGEPPAGLMLVGETMDDVRLFAIAMAVETALAG